MENSLISIVVPVYKVEKYLNKCIDSIINQSYKNLEILLIDDGSPDNCPKICDEYAKQDTRITVIHKTNGGLSDARNTGINNASGQFIGFIDSDDYIENEMYSYLYELIKKYDADISMCGYRWFNDDTNEVVVPDEEMVLGPTDALKLLAKDNVIKNFAVNKLYKTSLFKDNKIEYPKGLLMEDIATTYKLIEKSNVIAVGNKWFYNYLKRTDSIIGSKSSKMYISQVNNTINRYNHFKDDEELGFYFYENAFYVLMRMYIDNDKDTICYIDENHILDNILEDGKKYRYYDKLSKMDKIRLFILKRNRNLYRIIMNMRRRINN